MRDLQSMLHHASIPVADLAKSRDLYEFALSKLGYVVVCEAENFVGFGTEPEKDKFALKHSSMATPLGPQGHLAFSAPSRKTVDEFHRAAIEKGATDNGPAGFRPNYGPNYYACFIIDFDGHQIEAVFNAKSDIDV